MLVIRERAGQVETLTLNRPEAANSLNPPLMAELGSALHEILLDVDVRAVVVTGAGERVFCAGMDLTALGGFDTDPSTWDDPEGARVLFRFLDGAYEKPLIAAVNGAAVGGGLEIVMACDLVVAAEHARFGLPEVKRGLFAAGGGVFVSTRIPLAVALELTLTGDSIDAGRALSLGLINQVVPPAEVLDAAFALAERIARNGPLALHATKQMVRTASTDLERAKVLAAEWQPKVFGSEDAKEGATAFIEKRDPVWKGR